MSNETPNRHEEEVDLGSLFTIIGKGITNLMNAIINAVNYCFSVFISFILFLKKNSFKIGAGIIIGAAIGAFLDYDKETTYESEMIVKPNYSSANQLYAIVNQCNNMVVQNDTIALGENLNISVNEASSIKKIKVIPIKNTNDIVISYNELMTEVDTITFRNQPYSFLEYKNSFTNFDYFKHKIVVTASKNDIFKKLEQPIINLVENSEYFQKVKNNNTEQFKISSKLLYNDLAQLDSLSKVYNSTLINASSRGNSGTSIDLSKETTQKARELELFYTKRYLNSELENLNKKRVLKGDILNVLTQFQASGQKLGLSKTKTFRYGLIGGVFVLALLLMLQFNKYLEKYKK